MEISREDERPEVVMTAKDKDDINKFAAHLARANELRANIARKKKLVQVHEDAAEELIIMDDDASIFYNIGDVFVMDDKPVIESKLEKTKDNLTSEISSHEDELSSLERDMRSLKTCLYNKFGKVRIFSLSISIVSLHLIDHPVLFDPILANIHSNEISFYVYLSSNPDADYQS